ncbi:MAG: hypothetical protein Fur0037_01110 [Planctomycetota bacterium]
MRAIAAVLLALASCTQAIRYSDALTDRRTGRTIFVRAPASLGGFVGFLAGVPLDLAVLPVSYPIYATSPAESRDALSIFLFPSFVFWRAGVLLALPFDAIEYAVWRGWAGPPKLSPEEREQIERRLDDRQWDSFPVAPLYPIEEPERPGASSASGAAPGAGPG